MARIAFLVLLCGLLAMPALAADPSIDTAIQSLTLQIKRDEGILEHPANITATKQARQQLREGLNEFGFIIHRFDIRFGETEPEMIKDLHRIYEEEQQEAESGRMSHRALENTRGIIQKNLPLKKTILKRARELVYGEQ